MATHNVQFLPVLCVESELIFILMLIWVFIYLVYRMYMEVRRQLEESGVGRDGQFLSGSGSRFGLHSVWL